MASDARRVVLLAEDDRHILALLARMLDSHGWHVHTCRDGLSALQIVDEYRLDAVVTDLHLAGGPSGEMVLEYASRRSAACKLILVSGWITRRARERARAIGAAIFEKPVDFDALLEELNRGPQAPA